MKTYKVLGDDGNEYGPVSGDQIKKWISESRLELKSPVMPDDAKDWIPLEELPEFNSTFAPPVIGRHESADAGNGINAIIPYKNIRALVAYYLGVFSVIPFIGIVFGICGFILGVGGLAFKRKHPSAGGAVHAWIGIILGGIFGAGWLIATILMIVAAVKHRH